MPVTAIDTNRLFRALKATGKAENFSAEDLVGAFDAAQSDGDLVTRAYFDTRLAGVDANGAVPDTRMDALESRMDALGGRMDLLDARMDTFDAKLDTMRAEMRLELKSGQLQTIYALAGIILVSNGAVIALLGRVARLY